VLCTILGVEVVNLKEKKLCSLWAGYGSICALSLECKQAAGMQLICKYVDPPSEDGVSHERKVTSYIVESEFYRKYSQRCIDNGVNVPRIFHTSSNSSGKVTILMSDLRPRFSIPASGLNWEKTISAIDWLARFHALHWGNPDATEKKLWPEGCYWRLDTRLDEFDSMGRKWNRLKNAARVIADLLRDGTDARTSVVPKFQTFVHGDFKSANLQFCSRTNAATATNDATTSVNGSVESSFECAVVDFQYVGAGYGVRDLVMMFVSSFDMPRQYTAMLQAESEMLRVYHIKLSEYISQFSVNGLIPAPSQMYSLEQLTKHYELSLLDYVRFMAGWGMWGNTEYAEQRAMDLLKKIDAGVCLSPAEYDIAVRAVYAT